MNSYELLEMFTSLRNFWNDQVVKDLVLLFSSVDFSNRTSVVDALYCGNNRKFLLDVAFSFCFTISDEWEFVLVRAYWA